MNKRMTREPSRRTVLTWTALVAWTAGVALTALPGSATVNTTIAITSSIGVPDRGDTANAIDGDLGTETYTTPSGTQVYPAYLEFGFTSAAVNRVRLYKTTSNVGPRDLIIQYTTGTGSLTSRTWTTVTGLSNGYLGAELLVADAVNSNGTVDVDRHDSPAGDGWASLTFDAVMATGVRIGFDRPNLTDPCCNHYHVYEFQAVYNDAAAPVVSVASLTQGKDYGTAGAYSLTAAFSVTDTDSPPSSASYECTLDDPTNLAASWSACTNPQVFTGLTAGTPYTVSVRATDLGSNVGDYDSESATIVADSTAPTISSLSATGAKNRVTMQFAATDSDDTTAHLTYECQLDAGSWGACASSTGHTFDSVPGGTHTTHLRVSDLYGNTSSTANATVRAKGSPKS